MKATAQLCPKAPSWRAEWSQTQAWKTNVSETDKSRSWHRRKAWAQKRQGAQRRPAHGDYEKINL